MDVNIEHRELRRMRCSWRLAKNGIYPLFLEHSAGVSWEPEQRFVHAGIGVFDRTSQRANMYATRANINTRAVLCWELLELTHLPPPPPPPFAPYLLRILCSAASAAAATGIRENMTHVFRRTHTHTHARERDTRTQVDGGCVDLGRTVKIDDRFKNKD